MEEWKINRLESCVRGENPTLLTRVKSGFAVIADSQFLPGYCILLAYPKAGSLNELPVSYRERFLLEMTLIGDAIMEVCKPLRLNYSILGNADNFLHAHIQPRYDWEPDEYKYMPAWLYPKEQFYNEDCMFTEWKYGAMKSKITNRLIDVLRKSDY